jgi:hypothetical protein
VEILTGFGVNNLPRVFGMGDTEVIGGRTPAQWIGSFALFIVMLLAAVQAAQLVGWTAVVVAIGALGAQIVQIAFGLIIILIGIYLASIAARIVAGTSVANRNLLAWLVRAVIIAFIGALGLAAMGIAEQIVVVAFGLFFGAIAVAVAIAFGWGGRETAGRQIAQWAQSLAGGTPSEATPQAPGEEAGTSA